MCAGSGGLKDSQHISEKYHFCKKYPSKDIWDLGDIRQWWSNRFPGSLRSAAPSLGCPFLQPHRTAHSHLDHELLKW